VSIAGRLAPLGALFLVAQASAAPATREVQDDTGERVTVPADNCRMVSLAPGTTAMLFAAGAGKCVIGTIAHSKEPAEAAAVPIVGDAETLDFEQLLALRPTSVVVAVDVVQRVRIDRIRALGIPVYQVHVTALAQMPQSLRRLGKLAGTQQAAQRRAELFAAQLGLVAGRYRSRAPVRTGLSTRSAENTSSPTRWRCAGRATYSPTSPRPRRRSRARPRSCATPT
jgi:iron complex transport system substrate-binding protein